jgi:hypothetical protein
MEQLLQPHFTFGGYGMRLLLTTVYRYHVKGVLIHSVDTNKEQSVLTEGPLGAQMYCIDYISFFCKKSLRISNDNLYNALVSIFIALSIIPVLLLSKCFGMSLLNYLSFVA